MLDDLEERSARRYVPPVDLALIRLELGDTDRAFELLDQSRLDRSFWFIYCIRFPLFTAIRSDARFNELLNRMNLKP